MHWKPFLTARRAIPAAVFLPMAITGNRNIKSSQPDVVLMDIEMPGLNGIEVTQHINDEFPEIKILDPNRF